MIFVQINIEVKTKSLVDYDISFCIRCYSYMNVNFDSWNYTLERKLNEG